MAWIAARMIYCRMFSSLANEEARLDWTPGIVVLSETTAVFQSQDLLSSTRD